MCPIETDIFAVSIGIKDRFAEPFAITGSRTRFVVEPGNLHRDRALIAAGTRALAASQVG
jgi:hypothetical protein